MQVHRASIGDPDDYVVTDGFFGRPLIDRGEWRDTPVPHRNVPLPMRTIDPATTSSRPCELPL
jgi:hypothetical protein